MVGLRPRKHPCELREKIGTNVQRGRGQTPPNQLEPAEKNTSVSYWLLVVLRVILARGLAESRHERQKEGIHLVDGLLTTEE